jgi:hypothetical protein
MKTWLSAMATVAATVLIGAGSVQAHPTAAASSTSWSGQSWRIASGVNGAGQRNCSNHVSFGSSLTIKVYGGCGGGVTGSINKHQGTWSVRFRDTRGGGKYAIGLWPQSGSRPEVDFAEDKPTDSSRSLTTGTFHPKPGCTGCIHSKLSGDFTQWHTASVQWSSSGWTLTMDGKPWAHYSGSYGGQLHIFIHNEAWGSSGSSTLEVASVNA